MHPECGIMSTEFHCHNYILIPDLPMSEVSSSFPLEAQSCNNALTTGVCTCHVRERIEQWGNTEQ